jgi:hypothetical protein
MDFIAILAQASGASHHFVVPVDKIYEQITALGWLQAIIAISFGVVYLLYGWRIFKVIASLSFALFGMRVGMWMGGQLGNTLAGGVIGFILLAILAVPLIRWAVCILGAVAGGVLTGCLWYACGLPEQYLWAGALVGVVGGGMISFIIFKIAVMLFSSLAGSAIVMAGVLALFHHYEPTTHHVKDMIYNYKWFMPAALIVPTIFGIYIQSRFIKGAKDWDL